MKFFQQGRHIGDIENYKVADGEFSGVLVRFTEKANLDLDPHYVGEDDESKREVLLSNTGIVAEAPSTMWLMGSFSGT